MNLTQTLLDCQDEVEHLATNGFYAKAYRASEFGYWQPILHWMAEDFEDYATIWPRRVLDVGCAYGTLLAVSRRLAGEGCELYGLDFSESFMSRALIDANRIKFSMRNIELDPLPWDVKFDVIILTEVLEHFNFQAAPTLRKLRDALEPGGKMYLSTPDASEWGKVKKYPDYESLPQPGPGMEIADEHVWQFSEAELCRVIADSGLSITRFGYSPGNGMRHFNLTLEAA